MISLLAPLAARGAVVEALRAASHAPETAALRARGSGPWPPYSFADFAEEAAA